MNKLSIVKQITIWYSLILIFAIGTLYAAFYLQTKKYLLFETDRSLETHAVQVANNISQNSSNIHDEKTQALIRLNEKDIPGMYMEILDPQGINTNDEKSAFADLAAKALQTGQPSYTQSRLGTSDLRVAAFPISGQEGYLGTVVMGHSIEIYNSTFNQLRDTGIFIVLFLVIPSIAAAYFLARNALAPVTKLSVEIDRINSENLSTKVKTAPTSSETKMLIDNFNSMLRRLHSAFALERQFLGEMAHEIKTPISVIKTNCEYILSKERKPEEYKESIQQTLKHTDKLATNLKHLMDFAWSQDSEIKSSFKKFSLSALMAEITDTALYFSKAKNISIESAIEPDVFITGNQDKLFQAVQNIVDNAIKYTDRGGNILLSLSKKDHTAAITISDNGKGIEEWQLSKIFDRFYRSEKEKNIAGHGLGLAITASIIKAHEGKIDVQSEVGKGTTFKITLKTSS